MWCSKNQSRNKARKREWFANTNNAVSNPAAPKTHKIYDLKKNFFGIKFGDFGEIWWNYIYSGEAKFGI